jgi:hypothetical protein
MDIRPVTHMDQVLAVAFAQPLTVTAPTLTAQRAPASGDAATAPQ